MSQDEGKNWEFRAVWRPDAKFCKEELLDEIISVFPSLEVSPITIGLSGSGWPKTATYKKFSQLRAKLGAAALVGFLFTIDAETDQGFGFISSRPDLVNRLIVQSRLLSESHDRRLRFVESFAKNVECEYGLCAISPFFPDTVSDCRLSFRGMCGDPTIYMMRIYMEANSRWEIEQGFKRTGDTTDYTIRLPIVHPYNVLRREHLNTRIDEFDATLAKWVTEDSSRGVLKQVSGYNTIWQVPRSSLEVVNRDLWSTSFYPVAKHFELGGWSTELDIPILRAKQSARKLLSTCTQEEAIFVN